MATQTETVGRTDIAALWERFHEELYGFVRGRVASDDVAQDVLQAAFLRAQQSLASSDGPNNPRAWLYQVVRNLTVDVRRRAARERALAAAVAAEPAAPGDDSDDAFALVARTLPLFIDRLDAPYREALEMVELRGLTQAEAAHGAGISLSGMKSRVQRARSMVREALQRCCAFELDARRRIVGCTSRESGEVCCDSD